MAVHRLQLNTYALRKGLMRLRSFTPIIGASLLHWNTPVFNAHVIIFNNRKPVCSTYSSLNNILIGIWILMNVLTQSNEEDIFSQKCVVSFLIYNMPFKRTLEDILRLQNIKSVCLLMLFLYLTYTFVSVIYIYDVSSNKIFNYFIYKWHEAIQQLVCNFKLHCDLLF